MDRLNINRIDQREDGKLKAEHPLRSWYKSPIWKAIKRHRLVQEPNCRKCANEGKSRPARHVAHIENHRNDWALFAKYANTQKSLS